MRGFGANQAHFAMEGCLDLLAEKVGLDGGEIRSRNVVEVGDVFSTGQVLEKARAAVDQGFGAVKLKVGGIDSRRDIEREVWGDVLPDSDTLRSHLYNLRKNIDRPFPRPLLHTIQNTGYRLYDQEER